VCLLQQRREAIPGGDHDDLLVGIEDLRLRASVMKAYTTATVAAPTRLRRGPEAI
jgi:hypothetical protein